MALRILVVLALLIACAGFAAGGIALAQNHTSDPARTITTIGQGSVPIVPDTATINVGAQTSKPDAATALADNAQTTAAVIAAERKLGIPSSAIQTQYFSLYYDPQQQQYQVSDNLSVQTGSVGQVSQALTAATKAGANNLGGVSFGVKNPKPAQAQALRQALSDARQRAEVEARQLGLRIIGVQSTTESTSVPTGPQCQSGCGGGGGGPPVQSGQLTVSASVSVTYNVK